MSRGHAGLNGSTGLTNSFEIWLFTHDFRTAFKNMS